MARLPVPGADGDSWGDVLNTFMRVSHREDGVLKTTLEVFNVKDYGAKGDGATDDTAAIRAALSALLNTGGVLYFTSGSYLITGTLSFNRQVRVEVLGNGWSSSLLWAFNGNLFEWPAGIVCRENSIRHLKITATQAAKSTSSAVVSCKGGVERSLFDHLLVYPNGAVRPGTGIEFVGTSDSTTIRDCIFWGIKGVGVKVGSGSEIRLEGGRILGDLSKTDGSIGLYLTGNNGGVHIVATDLIGLQEGVRIENASGAGSNREVFLTHATLDSCGQGLTVRDSSYVSLTGCWAASCDSDNLHVAPGFNPILSISGGSIFNAGVAGGNAATGRNGLTVNSGSFTLSGVHIRNNLGRGIWVPNSNVREYSITGCRITDNGQGAKLTGSCYQVGHNIFARNAQANEFLGTNFQTPDNLTC